MAVIIKTHRIIIREFLPQELEIYLGHILDENVALYITKRSKEERIILFHEAIERYKAPNICGTWGMFNPINDDFIGSCLLRPLDDKTDVLELGYSLEPKYWGQGLATEMANALVAYSFADRHIQELVARTDMANIASQRVLQKAGFIQVDNLVRNGEELAFFRLSR